MPQFRITTVSALDGRPTTKKFTGTNAECAAREVWDGVNHHSSRRLYAFALFLQLSDNGEYTKAIVDQFARP